MKKNLHNMGKRLLALVLTLALMLAFVPRIVMPAKAAVTVSDITGKAVDPATIHNWKQYFDIMSTEYTGGVWTDKSVFNSFSDYLSAEGVQNFVGPNGTAITNNVRQMLATDPANFLVAMSAITANKSISGSSSTPMDNMLVLDVSGSMQGNNAVAMVEATNRAIKTLLDQNVNNRVGVILYSGNHSYGNSQTNTASLLLPLGRYTTTDTMSVGNATIPAYLTISGSGNSQTISVASSINNGTAADSKTVRGATYIQNGLYQAWKQFEKVTDVKVPAGQPQAGVQRTPVIILMSDGAPTAATTSYNNVDTSNLGDGSDTTNRMGFLTQLTAAYVRGKVQQKYGTAPKFYTLGVGTGNDSVATSVLNPAGSNDTLTGYWSAFMNGTDGQNVQIVSQSWGQSGWSVYKDAAVKGKNYVDKYWLTSDSTGLIKAFKEIVNTIVLESEHYSTLVDISQGAHLSGYVTFEDELGELMEVKSVKGMVMGNKIFTGAELAKGMTSGVLGTVDGPTAAGDELVRTVKERMGIAETSVAQTLIDNAYNAGQLSYTSATEYSNYIGWYADKDGKYVGFWQESDGYSAENAPATAKYINKSYGYLGTPLDQSGAGSDMMHIVVMVRTEIATGRQSVVYKIPASLLPSVTYHVELNGEDVTNVKSLEREGADPMRLLFEVGLRSDINPVNIAQKVAEYDALDGTHIHANDDGTYTFYTNRWGSGDGEQDVDYNEPLTHLVAESHFHPALENERYYHVENDLVYSDQNGTVYSGTAAPSGSGYYFARHYYELVGSTVMYREEYRSINPTVLALAQKGDNGWYIPEGTAHSLERFAQTKTENATDTLNYSWNPVILHDSEGYHSYTFMGNNGTFTLTPAQGISLKKTVSEEVANAPTTFQFKIALSQAVANPTVTDTDGNPLENIHTVSGNVITVNIKKDQTVVITGIPTGVTYTVEEVVNGYYTPTISGKTGTVAAGTITKVEVTNAPKIYNDLIVSKDVTHPFVNVPQALAQQTFTIVVDLDGDDVVNKTFDVTGLTGMTAVTTDGEGKFSVELRDGESFTVKNLSEGVTYQVTETNIPTGYTLVAGSSVLSGTIRDGAPAQAHVVNNYAPAPADTTLTITGEKTVTSSGNMTYDWTGKSFQFKLESYDPATQTYKQVGELKEVVENGGKYTFTLPGVTFNALGTYYYKVSEVIPEQNDREAHMAYDATTGRIVVHVTDNDVDGKLELDVRNYDTDEVLAVNNNVINFTKNFNNTYTEDYNPTFVEFTVDKDVLDDHNTGATAAGYLFGLYKEGSTTPAYTMRSVGAEGKATFHIPITAPIAGDTYILKEIVPADADKIPGMVYDTTEYQVVISATADGKELTPSVVITKGGQTVVELVFKNKMDLDPASAQFGVEKKVEGNPPAEEYTFTLTETDGSFATAKQGGITDTVKINGAGHSRFQNITYTAVGTHYYVVKETPGTNPGVTYDASEYHITVNVVYENGKLVANTTITKPGAGAVQDIVFTNTYAITGTAEVNIHGTKLLEGRELLAGEFEFGLYEDGVSGESLLQRVTNATNGKFAFSTITYTEPGNHEYTVKEIVPAEKLGGVTYSTEEYTVRVHVRDNGEGGLSVKQEISLPNASVASYDDLIITNTYKAASVSKAITAEKTWSNTVTGEDKAIPAGKFSFTLYHSDAAYTTEESGITVANDAQGKVSFSKTYTAIGTYHYILREVIGDESTVDYDAGRYLIRDVVTDDGKGQLHVIRTVVRDGVGETDKIAFSNLYTPAASKPFAITGMKTLTGRKLENGEFTFGLYQDGELLQEAKNNGNTFAFEPIVYEKSGTYTYTVKEQAPVKKGESYKGVIYDYTEYQVTITVTDENGQLKVSSSHAPSQIIFQNTYEIAETPKTSDTANLPLYAAMMALSALGFVATLILRKKEEHAN